MKPIMISVGQMRYPRYFLKVKFQKKLEKLHAKWNCG